MGKGEATGVDGKVGGKDIEGNLMYICKQWKTIAYKKNNSERSSVNSDDLSTTYRVFLDYLTNIIPFFFLNYYDILVRFQNCIKHF